MSNVTFRQTKSRYELLVDEDVAAFADFVAADGVVELPHTVTDPAYRGKGYAAKLVTHVLDELLSDAATVLPSCSYVARFIDEHPKYQALLK
jgi:uncharacterized protein